MSLRLKVVFGYLNAYHGKVNKLCSGQLRKSSSVGSFEYTSLEVEPALTSEQKSFYAENGYIILKNLVPKQKLEKYRNRFQDICTGKLSSDTMILMRDVAICKSEFVRSEKTISRLHNFQFDDVLFEYCCLPEVLKYVKTFVGPNVMAVKTMLINKPPDPGTMTTRQPMHQDTYYLPLRSTNRIVCSWTAMQKIDRNNGCLAVMPGTHKGELLEHDYPEWEGGVNKFYHGIKNYNPERNDRVWLEMAEGDTVFFHPGLIHGSGSNKTDDSRKSISCHYAASECEYTEKYDTNQEKLAKEFEELGQKPSRTKYNAQVSYKDSYKHQARLVCGVQINL